MPRVQPQEGSVDLVVFGQGVRNLRQVRGWSIKSLAKRAGVASHTVHRVETGFPSTKTIRSRIAFALDTVVERLGFDSGLIGQNVSTSDPQNDRWLGLIDRRLILPEDNEVAIQSAEERDRLGKLGFVTQFVKILKCRLPTGKLVSGILEIYGDLPPSTYLGGELFAFALRGDSFLNHNGDSYLLKEGSSCTFDCTKPFYFSPREPVLRAALPTLVLYVRLEEIEPIANRRRKRGRAVQNQIEEWGYSDDPSINEPKARPGVGKRPST